MVFANASNEKCTRYRAAAFVWYGLSKTDGRNRAKAMERYSFPYQRGLHNRLTRTTLKPVMIICAAVVLALPFVLTGVMTVQANRNSAALAKLLDEEDRKSVV